MFFHLLFSGSIKAQGGSYHFGFKGTVVSGIFIFLLPLLAGADSIWFAMPLIELLAAVYVVCMIMRYIKQLTTERKGAYE